MRKKIFFALVLFIGLTGSFLSMLDWDLSIIASLFAAPLSFSGLGNGLLLIFNRLFAVSEQHQLFRYVMFHISSPEGDWSGNIAAAFVVITAIFAGLSIVLATARRKWFIVVIMIIIVGVQIYFGVFPGAMWNIGLFATFAIMLASGQQEDGRVAFWGIAAVLILLFIVSAVVWVAYPGRNMQLHEFSESIRDRFDTPLNPFAVAPFGTHDVAIQPEPDNLDLNIADVQDDTLHENHTVDYLAEYDERAQGAQIGFAAPQLSLLPAIILVISLMIITAIIRFVPPLLRAAKRRKMFDLDDRTVAINNMFIYLLEWLAIIGLEQKNVVFSAYAPRLAVLMSQQYSDEYLSLAAVWQRAVYSNHTPSEAERKLMKEFLNKSTNFVWKKSSLVVKLKIKFHHFL